MAFTLKDLPDYDALAYELLHCSMDHLIDLGARCNAHSDVLDADDTDPDDEQPSPIRVLKAQLGLNGAEDEVQEIQRLIQILSAILITRHTRRVIHHGPSPADHDCCGDRLDSSTRESDPAPGPAAGAQDGSDLPD
jgi:hypothetical protein